MELELSAAVKWLLGTNSSPLQEQHASLTTEPSLQPTYKQNLSEV